MAKIKDFIFFGKLDSGKHCNAGKSAIWRDKCSIFHTGYRKLYWMLRKGYNFAPESICTDIWPKAILLTKQIEVWWTTYEKKKTLLLQERPGYKKAFSFPRGLLTQAVKRLTWETKFSGFPLPRLSIQACHLSALLTWHACYKSILIS